VTGFVCIFEDKKFSNFFPLSLSRPVFELRIGFQNLRLRMLDELTPPSHGILCRDYLADLMRIDYPDLLVNDIEEMASNGGGDDSSGDGILFVNGRLLCFGDELQKLLAAIPPNGIAIKGGYVVAARLEKKAAGDFARYIQTRISEDAIHRLCGELKGYVTKTPAHGEEKKRKKPASAPLPSESSFEDAQEVGKDDVQEKIPQALSDLIRANSITSVDMQAARLISFPWQIIEESARVIEDDFNKLALRGQGEEAIVFPGVHMVGEENIVIGEATVIKPGVVLDASTGPIIIGDGTMIMANATISGPVYIGRQSLIRAGAKILEGTSIGDVCKIGGEVDGTIFASFSNKQHDGFMGHSYIGEWVNIGAGTNNSDLKNNYSPVRMWCAGSVRETGRQFLGLIMGDHTKTGINTMFNTGTVVGFNCNFYGSEPPVKFVPSFSWGDSRNMDVYDPEKGMQTAEAVMGRRQRKFEQAHKALFLKIFDLSQKSAKNI
jgi:UDP-N-acetylglucosamine diphosphorylase/glucosamine-1-phosphate N-acetyltransferase